MLFENRKIPVLGSQTAKAAPARANQTIACAWLNQRVTGITQ